jgi:hypothetical protein
MALSGHVSGEQKTDTPLSLFARPVFEQSYGGVEFWP